MYKVGDVVWWWDLNEEEKTMHLLKGCVQDFNDNALKINGLWNMLEDEQTYFLSKKDAIDGIENFVKNLEEHLELIKSQMDIFKKEDESVVVQN